MLVNLYAVRVILNSLGAEDYGIYNVVAGVVTMFGFLSNTMATASQRYFSFEIGRNNFERLKNIFSLNFTIYLLIAIIILILAETIGLWFINNKLIIPIARKEIVQWVYHFSVISFLFTILTSPYMAAIIAHEDMNIYAYVSIVEAVLKLGIVFLLQFILMDKLKLYGILICIVTIINTTIYRTICIIKYRECKFRFYWDSELFKEITGYTGWNLFGTIAVILRNQGITILLNQFFNPIVSAARIIANSIDNVVTGFANNFNIAMQPRIIKQYATKEHMKAITLALRSVKVVCFLLSIFILPFFIETQTILSLWLKNPPEYSVLFTRLILINVFIDSIFYPIRTLVMATGNIKMFQIVTGSILLFNLPLSWIVLLFGAEPYSVAIISIALAVLVKIIQLPIEKKLIPLFPLKIFFKQIVLRISIVSVLSIVFPYFIYKNIPQTFLRLYLITGTSIISVSSCMYVFGLNAGERKIVKSIIEKRIFNKLKGNKQYD